MGQWDNGTLAGHCVLADSCAVLLYSTTCYQDERVDSPLTGYYSLLFGKLSKKKKILRMEDNNLGTGVPDAFLYFHYWMHYLCNYLNYSLLFWKLSKKTACTFLTSSTVHCSNIVLLLSCIIFTGSIY